MSEANLARSMPCVAKGEAWAFKTLRMARHFHYIINMYFVYLLKSKNHPDQRYIGVTQNLQKRLEQHNNGQSTHTSKFMPWTIEMYLAFNDKDKAYSFEQYLKSHSGKAFASKRFL
ncbi:MAG: GIY-YIG nuclease family protein [Alphaproteobacteria bacterium]